MNTSPASPPDRSAIKLNLALLKKEEPPPLPPDEDESSLPPLPTIPPLKTNGLSSPGSPSDSKSPERAKSERSIAALLSPRHSSKAEKKEKKDRKEKEKKEKKERKEKEKKEKKEKASKSPDLPRVEHSPRRRASTGFPSFFKRDGPIRPTKSEVPTPEKGPKVSEITPEKEHQTEQVLPQAEGTAQTDKAVQTENDVRIEKATQQPEEPQIEEKSGKQEVVTHHEELTVPVDEVQERASKKEEIKESSESKKEITEEKQESTRVLPDAVTVDGYRERLRAMTQPNRPCPPEPTISSDSPEMIALKTKVKNLEAQLVRLAAAEAKAASLEKRLQDEKTKSQILQAKIDFLEDSTAKADIRRATSQDNTPKSPKVSQRNSPNMFRDIKRGDDSSSYEDFRIRGRSLSISSDLRSSVEINPEFRYYEFGEEDTEENIAYFDDGADDDTQSVGSVDRKQGIFDSFFGLEIGKKKQKGKQPKIIEVKILEGKELDLQENSAIAICKIVPNGSGTLEIDNIKGSKIKVPKKHVNPAQCEGVSLMFTDLHSESLYVAVMLTTLTEAPKFIGSKIVPINDLTEDSPKDVWTKLEGTTSSVHLQISYGVESALSDRFQLHIKGATLSKLIEKITPADKNERDFEFTTDFLLTYRLFTTPSELLRHLIRRYQGPSEADFPDLGRYERTLRGIRSSVGQVILKWLETTRDFRDNVELSEQLNQFITSGTKLNSQLSTCLKIVKDITGVPTRVIFGRPNSKSVHLSSSAYAPQTTGEKTAGDRDLVRTNSSLSARKVVFTDVDPTLLADQICLVEYDMLRAVRNTEFLKQAWSKSEKNEKAPHILKYVQWFNKISNWVSTEIVKRMTAEERSVVIAYFISAAMRFKENSNYNGVMEIISSLHSAGISRLKQTWALLPKESVDNLDLLSSLMGPAENFKQYRDACKAAKGTLIPYLGLWLQDLTFIDDGNPEQVEGNLINVEKARMVAKRIREFQDGLVVPYHFTPIPTVQESLQDVEVWEDNDIFRVSKLREARAENPDALMRRFDSKSFAKISRSILAGKENVSMNSQTKLTSRDWQLLLAVSTVASFPSGSEIIEEGSTNNFLYKIKRGTVRIEKRTGDSVKVLNTMTVPHTFGEMSTLGEYGIASASVISDDDVELYAMEMDFVQKVFESEPGMAMRFFFRIAQQLSQRLVSLAPPDRSKQQAPAVSEAEKHEEKEENAADSILRTEFNLDRDQIVLKSFRADLKKKVLLHGTLLVTAQYVCFFAKSFGLKTKQVLSVSEIAKLKAKEEKELHIETSKSKHFKFGFKNKQDASDALEFIKQLSAKKPLPGTRLSRVFTTELATPRSRSSTLDTDEMGRVFKVLPAEDWDLFLKGAKSLHVDKDGAVTTQGEVYQRIYQISRGHCRIEIVKEGQRIVVGKMGQGETFGEISFLNEGKGGASASVIADSEGGVELTIIEGYFINALMNVNQAFGARFFKYLAALLAARIRERERRNS
eukprot:TRINITY_DN2649_c0_g1_i2.p1 TRINITY_DN2649_c0_g1~~TRINITY_DN2649_c0_g1_i2.p1  ORF type:complete len:1487 (-),score=443.17 TRINITY_DN2649_c0_g1_i2:51-4511(-)